MPDTFRTVVSFAVLMALMLSGCAGVHLYRAEEDTLAGQASDKYQSIDLLTVIDTERGNLDATLEYELLVVDRLIDVVLQREWFRLVSSTEPMTKSFMEKLIDKRKSELGVDRFSREQITDLIRLEAELRLIDRQLVDANGIARRLYGVNFPLCGKAALPESLPAGTVRKASKYANKMRGDGGTFALEQVLYPEFRNKCGERNAQLVNTLKPFRESEEMGLLSRAVDDWQQALLALVDEHNAAQQAKAEYDAAVDDLRGVLERRERTDSVISEEVASRSERIGDLLERIETNSGAVGLADATTERIANIDVMLSALVAAEVDETALTDSSVARSAVIAASVNSLSNEVKALYDKRSLNPVGPLILEKERQLVLREMAGTRIARQERKVELLRQRYIAVTDELELIRLIENTAELDGVDDVLAKPASDALARNCRSEACAEVYRMLLKYVEMIDSVRRRLEKVDYYLIDLDHRIALDESASAIGLWNAMIETPLEQLAAYYKSGYSTEALANTIVNLTTLGAIAVGVND